MPDPVVGVMDRPQSKPADFYRELGELFGVGLTPLNRYDGFKALQTKCKNHCLSTLGRLVLLINEAQEVSSSCLTELRLLQSATFDSESILYTIIPSFAAANVYRDGSAPRNFSPWEAVSESDSNWRPLTPEQLREYISFSLEQAGNPHLMTRELIQSLIERFLKELPPIDGARWLLERKYGTVSC